MTKNLFKNSSLMNDHDKDKQFQSLCDAFLLLKSRDECRRFLLDLCTPLEINSLSERWHIAKILNEDKLSYREINAQTGISVTTIGRVARFLLQESYKGYQIVLQRIKN